MPRVEAEIRSRDIEDMLAQMSITEEPPPVEVGVNFPRLLTQSEQLGLADESEIIAATATAYRVVPTNLLASPMFEDLTDWDLSADGRHTITWESGGVYPLPQLRAAEGVQVKLTGSTGSGATTLDQRVSLLSGTVYSLEVWVRVLSVSGAQVMMRAQALTASGTVRRQSSWQILNSASASWRLLKLDGWSISGLSDVTQVRVRLQVQSTGSGQSLTAELTGARLIERASLLTWDERAVAGFSRAS